MMVLLQEGKLGLFNSFFCSVWKKSFGGSTARRVSTTLFVHIGSYRSDLGLLIDEKGIDKLTEDKLVLLACHFTIFGRWPEFNHACSGLSIRAFYENPILKAAFDGYRNQITTDMMHTAAVVGAGSLLDAKFGGKEVDRIQQVRFLFTDALGQSEDRRELYAIAWACKLLEDHAFADAGGFEDIIEVFNPNPKALNSFLTTHLMRS